MRGVAALAVLVALAVPALARGEAVPGLEDASDAALAVAPDATPSVAGLVDGSLVLARRGAAGWTSDAGPPLPGARGTLAGAAVAGGGRAYALVEDAGGGWLVLAERAASGWRLHPLVPRVRRGATLGLAGLALDRNGRPVVAYVLATSPKQTWLRLVRPDRRGRYVTHAITRDGFPGSRDVPSAAPVVLPGGGVRVVEAYDGAAIEWAPQGRTWQGQFLWASTLGSSAGPVGAAAAPRAVWSAWTELYPGFGESHVLLTLHQNGERTTVLTTHAYLVALALGPAGPDIAANDYVATDATGGTADAGLVFTAGASPVELGGTLLGYAIDGTGARQLLLREPAGIAWYRTVGALAARVTLSAAPTPGGVLLTGAVSGATGGSVELYRELPDEPPELAATVPVGADGSFAASDVPPASPLLYRAVYRAAPDALPYGFLLRAPVASG